MSSDLAHVTAADIEPELEPSAPFPVCYFLLFEAKVIGVLYWHDLTMADVGPLSKDHEDPYDGWAADDELGWTFFLAESPASHHGLDRDFRLSREVAIAEARERVAKHVRVTGREGLIGLEDLPWHQRPWRLLPYPEEEQ